jgi:hypothetical protein
MLFQPEEGRAKGIELVLQNARTGPVNGWIGYSLSWAEEILEGKIIPKSFDQRHALHAEFEYQPNPRFQVNLSWQIHTGWRYAEATYEILPLTGGEFLYKAHYGPLNARRFPPYHRMDLRMARTFVFKRQSIAVFLEVRNLYNRKNVRLYTFERSESDEPTDPIVRVTRTWMPILPAIGVRWDFRY